MHLRVLPVIVFLVITCAAGRIVQAQMLGDVSASVMPSPADSSSMPTTHGYRDVRVVLNNLSATKTHNVTLTLPSNAGSSRGSSIRSITRTVKLAPQSSAVVSLFQPPLPIGGDGLSVDVDGRATTLPLYLSSHATPYYSGYRLLFVLTNASLADMTSQWVSRTESSSQRFVSQRSELPVEQWSNQWLAYTRYDAIVLKDSEMSHLSVDVSEALRRYTQAGGTLVVIGNEWSVPESWGLQQSDERGALKLRYVGLGMVVTFPDVQTAAANAVAMSDVLAENNTVWESRPDLDTANSRLPVVEKQTIPVSGLLTLIILFAIVIGPLNLWLLGRKRKRMWLLWTVPTVSILTSGAIWGYSLVAEGWRGQCRVRTLTLLDQPNFTATTIGWAGYYAPLTPADGLRFSAETELTPLIDNRYYRSGSSSNRARTIDLTTDQHLDSGWIAARVPAFFMLRNTATSVRPRLVFAKDDRQKVTVTNGLGVDLARLIYIDHDGLRYHMTSPLSAGEKTEMVRTRGEVKNFNMLRLHELFVGNWMDNFDRLELVFNGRDPIRSGIRPFGPGMYLAETDAPCPFLQPGMKNLKTEQHQTYIIGVTDPGPGPRNAEP